MKKYKYIGKHNGNFSWNGQYIDLKTISDELIERLISENEGWNRYFQLVKKKNSNTE